ncbi:aminotransferase class V-fold PLP-dependent enzyme [Bacillus sp. B6(2022)]|nr:aminotransferase class V-fold PLP-dependent enzyme [Bacillus sp. B6(2022)]
MERIYLDHAATTPMDQRIVDKMMPYFTEIFGNPSSIHSYGREARKWLDEARKSLQENYTVSSRRSSSQAGNRGRQLGHYRCCNGKAA